MGIFTKSGDEGDTSLFGGKRVKKSSKVIRAIGDIDELCASISLLGDALSTLKMQDLSDKVQQICDQLFTVGADLANPKKHEDKEDSFITEFDINSLEADMNEWDATLPQLTHFVLPSGHRAALSAYYSRAVCRRAERSIVDLMESENINPRITKYINRLGDWLFECFRIINHRLDKKERLWNAN